VRFTDSQLGDNFYLGLTAEAAEVLPLSYGVTARPFAELLRRGRVRAGVHWHSAGDTSVFYGLTYLSPEFEDQPEGQVTGSLKLNFNF